jgi:hypothetical protein
MGSQSTNRVQEHFEEQVQPMMSRCSEAAEAAIHDNPLGITLAVFGAGLGLGVLLGCALAEPMGLKPQPVADNIGRKILDAISEHLPASIQKQLHA